MRIFTLLSYLFFCALCCACSSHSGVAERPNIIWINAEGISPALGKEIILQEEKALQAALDDSSPSVQIVAAESLCQVGKTKEALPVLAERVKEDRKWVALQAARSIEMMGKEAAPLVPTIREVLEKYMARPGKARLEMKEIYRF